MMGVAQARRLTRFRASERRVAAAEMAGATAAAANCGDRIEQINGLAAAVAAGPGEIFGAVLAARGEFVGRLLAAQMVATVQRDRQDANADEARRRFRLADARAGFADHGLAVAEQLDVAAAERRAVLKSPFRRVAP